MPLSCAPSSSSGSSSSRKERKEGGNGVLRRSQQLRSYHNEIQKRRTIFFTNSLVIHIYTHLEHSQLNLALAVAAVVTRKEGWKEGMGFYVALNSLGHITTRFRNPEPGRNSLLFTNSSTGSLSCYSGMKRLRGWPE